jgi:hypothetical protein
MHRCKTKQHQFADLVKFSTFFFYLCLFSRLDLCSFFSFLILYTVGCTPRTGDASVARPLPTHRTIQTQNKRTETSMSRVGFEPTTPVFERAKTFHAFRAATVIGTFPPPPSSSSIPVSPTWNIGHLWNASFHFSFLILGSR